MKTQQVSDKDILVQKITVSDGMVISEEKKDITLSKKISLRPQKSVIRKSIRPINLFSDSKSNTNSRY